VLYRRVDGNYGVIEPVVGDGSSQRKADGRSRQTRPRGVSGTTA
jgi:hypothetical protein